MQNVAALMSVLQPHKETLDPSTLLNFFIDQVLVVINEVKQKLIYKAGSKFNILNPDLFRDPSTESDSDSQSEKSQESEDETKKRTTKNQKSEPKKLIRNYPECPA